MIATGCSFVHQMAGIRTGLPLPSGWEVLLQLLVYSVTEYYTTCWIHRWSHSTWGYEKIHHVHHGYTTPSCFTAAYTHWTEFLVLGFPSFLGPAMVLVHTITFWLWMVLRHIESIETHRGYGVLFCFLYKLFFFLVSYSSFCCLSEI